MSGEIEVSKCEICGKENVQVNRKYYYYEIKCGCHFPYHFELIRHCKDCEPRPPRDIKVQLDGFKYLINEEDTIWNK